MPLQTVLGRVEVGKVEVGRVEVGRVQVGQRCRDKAHVNNVSCYVSLMCQSS